MTATKQEWATLERAVATWGEDAQAKMLLEEMAELQKEVCKAWRGKENTAEIAEEVADVEIMLEQIKLIFRIGDAVDVHRAAKLERLRLRLDDYDRRIEGTRSIEKAIGSFSDWSKDRLGVYICPECGQKAMRPIGDGHRQSCPNCGKEMELEE